MYRSAYAEVLEDTSSELRSREKAVFERALALLRKADSAGARSIEAVEALALVNRLWGVLIDDLASPENSLPNETRAGLISIGLWTMSEAEKIRVGEAQSFTAMIDVMETVAGGLA